MTNILTIDELKNSVLNANVDDEYIQPAIDEAQSIYLREILGDALLNAVINKINGNNLTGKYLTLVNEYIKPYLSYMVQSIIVVPITYKIRNAGVIQQYDNGFTSTQMKDTQYLKDYYDGKAEFYGNRLTEYLKKNASDIVEYRLSASNVTNPTTSQNVTNIFLGGTKRGKCGGMIPSGGGTHDTVDWDDITNRPNFAVVATSGSYNDLINKPTIPSLEGYATEQWVENQGYSTFSGDYEDLANKPELFSGDYNDLSNKPEIPTVNNATLTIKQGGTTKGTFTANAGTDVEINLDAGGSGSTDWSDITNKPNFATVATSGSYNDLSNRPSLATVATSGSYSDLSNTPSLATVATSGSYADLSNKPSLATVATSGSYDDLTDKPTIPTVPTNVSAFTNDAGYTTFDGDYDSLTNKPTIPAAQVNSDWNASTGVQQILNKPTLATVATSGSYNDLSNKPSLANVAPRGDYTDLSNTPSLATVATSGSYNDLSNKPTIPTVNNATLTIKQGGTTKGTFTANAGTDVEINLEAGGSGSTDWSDIQNKPTFATVATSGSYNDLSNTPSLATVATTGSYSDLSNTPSLATVATSGSYADLSNKPTIPDDETDLGLTTETWTFTLQDSSTVTKQVVIKPTV